MFAVIKTGGKQYKVAKNDVIRVEKLDAEPGARVEMETVLMVGDEGSQTVGAPYVEGARVAATVLEQTRADKIIVFKKKRRKNYRRKRGHRQHLTVLRIDDILTTAKPKKAAAAKSKDAAAKPAVKKDTKKKDAKKASAKGAATASKGTAKSAAKETAAKKPATKKTEE